MSNFPPRSMPPPTLPGPATKSDPTAMMLGILSIVFAGIAAFAFAILFGSAALVLGAFAWVKGKSRADRVRGVVGMSVGGAMLLLWAVTFAATINAV